MRRRIIICLGALFLLCLLGDAIAMFCLNRSIARLSRLAESHRVQSMRTELVSSAIRVEKDLLAYLSGHELDSGQRPDSLRRLRDSVSRCTRCHHPPALKAELDAVYETYRTYRDQSKRLFSAGPSDESAVMSKRAMALAHRLVSQTTELADRARKHIVPKQAAVKKSIHDAWVVLSLTLLAVLAAGGAVAFHLERRLNVPLAALMDGIERIRRGDTAYRFAIDADDEFRALGHALNEAYAGVTAAHDGVLRAEKMATAGRLAAGVAHEIGNPLASISSIAQVMRRRCASTQQTEHLDLILEEVARISRIVRELLTFSRPGVRDTHTCVDVGSLLDHATRLLRYDKRAERVRITCRHDDNLPTIRGDADRLLLVFTNIMMNALDAMNAGANGDPAGALDVTAFHDDSTITTRFADTGEGMTREQVADAFEPFVTTKEPGVGTGLGLWVCYQVVTAHKGTINIDSRPGQGTTVTVTLPVEQTGTADRQAPA